MQESRARRFHRRAVSYVARLASVLPIPRPGESIPVGLPSLRPGPLPRARGRGASGGVLRRSLRAAVAEGAAAEIFTACMGGVVLTGWAIFFGAGPLTVGLLGALPLASAVLHLPAAKLTQAYGRKRVALVAVGASRLVWLPLVLTPFVAVPDGYGLAMVVVLTGMSAVAAVIGNNAWTAWMGDLVPAPIRGRYFGNRTAILTAAGAATAVTAGVLLDTLHDARPLVLAALAAAACVAGVVSVFLMSRQHESPSPPGALGVSLADAQAVMRDPNAIPLVRYQAAWNGAVGVAAGFFGYHMLYHLEMGFTLTAAHGIGVAVVRVLAAPMWGRAVDRLGSRPVLAFCSLGIALVPVIWLFVTPDRLWPLLIEVIVAGTLWAGHGIAVFDLPFDLSPKNGRPIYLAVFATAGGLGFALASGLGGFLAGALPERFDLWGTTFTGIHVLFFLSAIARLFAALLAHPIPEPGARGVRELLGAFGEAFGRFVRLPRLNR